MHASRLVAILLLLQTRGQLTARELADELEVSLRTIYRDLEGLAAAGIPVYAERGPSGGYRLVEGYRTRLTGLNADEAEALFLSGLGGAAAQLGLGTVLAAAQLKVLAAMPPELRGRASRVRERFLLVAPGWFKEDEELPALATIAQAVWEGHRIRMRYDRRPEPVERIVEPFGLVLKAGIWYLVARREGSLRTYRVSRILEATELEESFDRPTDFDLGAYWGSSTEIFESSLRQVESACGSGATPSARCATPSAAAAWRACPTRCRTTRRVAGRHAPDRRPGRGPRGPAPGGRPGGGASTPRAA